MVVAARFVGAAGIGVGVGVAVGVGVGAGGGVVPATIETSFEGVLSTEALL